MCGFNGLFVFGVHDDVMISCFPYYWPFVRGIHRWPVDSPHKGPVIWNFDVFFDVCLNKLLTHWGRVTHICVSKITIIGSVKACRLDGAKPLSEPMLEFCELDPWVQTAVKFESRKKSFHEENAFENVCEMETIMSWPQCVKQAVELLLIWEAMMLMWCHRNLVGTWVNVQVPVK